jgi:signal transduction histidine kinase
MNEIHEGVDEGLINLKQEFIRKANKESGFAEDMIKHNPLNVRVVPISFSEAKDFQETFKTTKVYFPTELEDEEVRMLTTAFYCEQNDSYYKLELIVSTVESNDLIKNILYLTAALWLSLSVAFVMAGTFTIQRVTKPFYLLLDRLKNFNLDNRQMIDFPPTDISEFSDLNKSLERLLEENISVFTEQKTFLENASHEMQTPLAIITGKLDLLINDKNCTPEQITEIGQVLSMLNRMKRVNSNLLLLSKIKNRQFPGNEEIDLSNVIVEVSETFRDLIEFKELTVKLEKESVPFVKMNPDLAYIMITNLIKNAVAHNIKKGMIIIRIKSNEIVFANDGKSLPENSNIFERYNSGSADSNSSGIGLSIVKSIVDLYNFNISYRFDGLHTITLRF